MRPEESVINTAVCLTLEKWETVSGRFARYLNLHDANITAKSDRVDDPGLRLLGRFLITSRKVPSETK